jgi:hypothetical protein
VEENAAVGLHACIDGSACAWLGYRVMRMQACVRIRLVLSTVMKFHRRPILLMSHAAKWSFHRALRTLFSLMQCMLCVACHCSAWVMLVGAQPRSIRVCIPLAVNLEDARCPAFSASGARSPVYWKLSFGFVFVETFSLFLSYTKVLARSEWRLLMVCMMVAFESLETESTTTYLC